jgi:hypothetical protein
MTTVSKAYPVNIKGELTVMPSRWLWIFKWLLIIPHIFILYFLEIAAAVVWVIAWFAILFTGKYPKGLFDFSVGVLRWGWRVGFYSYGVLGTDKYPPFALESMADYPADLDVDYPEKLSRGLIFVKWWLLALPQWIIISIAKNIFQILVIIIAIILLFTGKYPADLFKLMVGINRWYYRVIAYASLMRDEYPPFRLWDS